MPATIFSGNNVKALKSNLDLNGVTKILSVNADPASGAGVAAPLGSIAMDYLAGKVYKKTGSLDTEWQELGSGIGGINYIENSDAESGTSGWSTYNDGGSQSQPVDGTGGTANITWNRRVPTAPLKPLRGVADFSLVKDNADRRGQGVSYDFTIDSADQAKILTISADYEVLSGTFATGDLAVYIIQDPAGTPVVLQPAGYQVTAATVGNKVRLAATFQTASDVTSYRLCIHVASTSASAYSLAIDNVSVSPQQVVYGAPVTDEKQASGISYEGLGTVTLESVWERQVGNKWHIRGYLKTGTTTASVAAIVLPSGKTIDTSKISSTTNVNRLGTFNRIETGGTATTPDGELFFDGSTTNKLFFCFQSASNQFTKANGNVLFSSGDGIAFEAEIPILGWSSSVVVSSSTDTRVVAARASGDPASATSGNPIIFPTTAFDTHGAYNSSTGRYTASVPGFYRISGAIIPGTGGAVGLFAYVNAVSVARAGNTDSNTSGVFTVLVQVNAGDLIDIRPNATLDAGSGSVINFERLSGPSQIAASETVAASYSASTGLVVADNTAILFDTKLIDSHGSYNSANGRITAQISGTYEIGMTVYSGTSNRQFTVFKNGTLFRGMAISLGSTATGTQGHFSTLVPMIAGDYLEIRNSSGASATLASSNFVGATISNSNFFNFKRVGN